MIYIRKLNFESIKKMENGDLLDSLNNSAIFSPCHCGRSTGISQSEMVSHGCKQETKNSTNVSSPAASTNVFYFPTIRAFVVCFDEKTLV